MDLPDTPYGFRLNNITTLNETSNDIFVLTSTMEEYKLFEFIIEGLGITIVSVLGIFGNILSACVLSRTQMKSSVSCLLLGLTFADTLLITSSILIFGLPVLFEYSGWNSLHYIHLYYTFGPFIFGIAVTGKLIYTAMAVWLYSAQDLLSVIIRERIFQTNKILKKWCSWGCVFS